MKKILVTGGNGQLAQAIGKLASIHPKREAVLMSSDQLDITNPTQIEEAFARGDYDYCVNCAAFTSVDEAEKNPLRAYAVNSEGARKIALACDQHEVVLFHISTDYVFDGTNKEGYRPGDMPNPINEYGRSKWIGEQHIQSILSDYFIIRTSWLYDFEHKNFYTAILRQAKERAEIRVTDQQFGCPTHVNTVAEFILHCIDDNSRNFGIHHVTDGAPMTWYQFAQRILKENQLEKSALLVRDENYRSFATRPLNSVLLP